MCGNDSDYRYNVIRAHREKTCVLPNGTTFSLNTRETRLNNNIAVIGTSGSNKTRSTVSTNILSATGSYIVSDPKGMLFKRFAPYMKGYGYKVRRLNLIHPEHSHGYNPIAYLHTTEDFRKMAHMIQYGTGPSLSNDPFWDRSAEMLLSSLIAYAVEGGFERAFQNLSKIVDLALEIEPDSYEMDKKTDLDIMMEKHSKTYQEKYQKPSWAYRQYKKFRRTPTKTMACVLMTLQATLGVFDTEEIQTMMQYDSMEIAKIGQEPTIIFVEISDTDRSKDVIANLFYTQAMNELCNFADAQPDNRLPVPVRFILDDFGTNCRIEGFENMIANIRSREISAVIILQSMSQLICGYDSSAHTILENCDTTIYTGGNDLETAEMIAKRTGQSVRQILNMPVCTNWILRRGQKPVFSETYDLSQYMLQPPDLIRVERINEKDIRRDEPDEAYDDVIPPEHRERIDQLMKKRMLNLTGIPPVTVKRVTWL